MAMSPQTKIALGLVGGLAVGSAVGYAVAVTRLGRRAVSAAEDAVDEVRLPDPSYAVELAQTPEGFDLLDEMICECGDPVLAAASADLSLESATEQIQQCLASGLYPDFPWPPISGDHPTAHQLWGELGLLARQALVKGEVCPGPVPSPIDIPEPQQNPGWWS